MNPRNTKSLYSDVTTRIIAELEKGRLPWVQPWSAEHLSAPLGLPKNAATGRAYSGINILILWDTDIKPSLGQALGPLNARRVSNGSACCSGEPILSGDNDLGTVVVG